MSASNNQKIPFIESMGNWLANQGLSQETRTGQSLPAEVVSVDSTGTIVVVKFLVADPDTGFPKSGILVPQVEMPVATDLYGIPPLQKGDKGYCLPADVYLGGVSDLGGGTANWHKPSNLSALAFHPLGKQKATKREEPDKYLISGPTGVHLVDLSGVAQVKIGPVAGGPANTMQLLVLINAPDDATAKARGVPLNGLYHTNGTVKVVWT